MRLTEAQLEAQLADAIKRRDLYAEEKIRYELRELRGHPHPVARRLIPDPIPRGGGMLTSAQLAEIVAVLKIAVIGPISGLAVASWSRERQDAYVSLHGCGYLDETLKPLTTRGRFVWSSCRVTEAGCEYLRQIESVRW